MNHYGIILRELRLKNNLTVKAAAVRIGRGAGWISEVENNKGAARIFPKEFERIVAAYSGEQYRKHFGIWVARTHKASVQPKEISFSGAILKYLRKKTKMSLKTAAYAANISACYLSRIETGSKPLSGKLRDKIMRVYGYSPSSFKNFSTEDSRGKNIPSHYKLKILLKQMDTESIERILGFALSIDKSSAALGGKVI